MSVSKETKTKKINNIDNKKFNYYLGLDLGISSVGWAVMSEERATGKHYLHDFGVRIFDVAEDPQSGETKAKKRRQHRSQRRLIRRRAYRIKRIKYFLEKNGFLGEEEFKEIFQEHKVDNKIILKNGQFTTEEEYWNPFLLRYKGLKEKLKRAELYFILIHFAKKRGYQDKSLMEEQEESENKRKKKETPFSKALDRGLGWENKTVAEIVLTDPEFRIRNDKTKKNEFLIYAKNGKYQPPEDKKRKNNENKNLGDVSYRVLFSRERYEKELTQILTKQKEYYQELNSVIEGKEGKTLWEILKETIFQQRGFEDGPKCKGHQKGQECQNKKSCSKYKTFLDLLGSCPYYPKEKRGYKSSLIFSVYHFVTEISKFLIFLQNKIKMNFSETNYQEMVDLFLNGGFDKKAVKKYLLSTQAWKERGSNSYFTLPGWKEMQLDKELFLKALQSSSVIKQFIPKIKNEALSKQIAKIKNSPINELGKILAKNITRTRRLKKIEKFLAENNWKPLDQWKKSEVDIVKNMKSKVTSPAKVSEKHMLETIENFLTSKLYATKREKIAYKPPIKGEGKEIFGKIVDWDLNKSPVVYRAVNQARKVLKALYKQYNSFENITIETGREVAKSWEDRKKIKNFYDKNAKTNEKILKELKELGLEESSKNLLSKKFWEEQEKICIYCGEKLGDFIQDNLKGWQVDHIVPVSKYADNSYSNKVLVHSTCNQEKKNRLPLEFIPINKQKAFQERAEKIRKKDWKKYNYLMMKNIDDGSLEDFVSRNLNDSRYIAKYFRTYVEYQINHFQKRKRNSKNLTSVLSATGEITSYLRRNYLRNSPWGLPTKVRDITYFHHAIDAATIAQIKGQYEIELAVDLVRLNQEWQKKERAKNSSLREERNKIVNNFFSFIKRKWKRRKKNDFVEKLEKIFPYYLSNKSSYIENFKEEIEKRIPVILGIKNCDCFNKKEIHLKKCSECKNARVIPIYKNLLNQKEWEEINLTKKRKELEGLISLDYPLISHMLNYKVRGSWASSENFGFKNNKLKTKYYGIWRKDPNLLETKNKNFVQKKIEKWEEWKKDFENKKGFIFIEKTGNIIPTDCYYGFDLSKKEGKEWIRIIDFSNKEKPILNQKKLVVKGVNIDFYDTEEKKSIIKVYRGKMGPKIYTHPNQLTFVGDFYKNKKIFRKTNCRSNFKTVKNSKLKIKKINILGKEEN